MEIRPLHKRLVVFSVPRRNKIAGSVIYQPQVNRGSMSQTQECWIVSAADDCQFKWKRGQKVIVQDGFELEPVRLDIWDENQNKPEFESLKRFVESCEGEVEAQFVAEGSILATEGNENE